jgi:Ca-activated chloride channel family protein
MNPIDIGPLTLGTPAALLALLLVPVVLLLRGHRGPAPAVRFPGAAALLPPRAERAARFGRFSRWLAALSFLLLTVALARPQFGETLTHTESSGVEIMLALDVSESMLAEDFTVGGQRANRLEAIKQVTRDFIEGRTSDRIGMVAFAGAPYLVSPLTLDHDWLAGNLDRVKIGLVEDGTAIGSAIASAANRLRNREAKSRVLVLLTDGDNNAGNITPKTAAEAAKALGIRVYTVGAGTRGAAPYPVGRHPFTGETIYRRMEVRFNEEGLREVADITGGKYFRATDTDSLRGIFAEIDRLEKTRVEITERRRFHDKYQWPAAAGMLCLAGALALGWTRERTIP